MNARMARLGLTGTAVECDIRTLVDSIGKDAGFADRAAMIAWSSRSHTQADEEDVERRVHTLRLSSPGPASPGQASPSSTRSSERRRQPSLP